MNIKRKNGLLVWKVSANGSLPIEDSVDQREDKVVRILTGPGLERSIVA